MILSSTLLALLAAPKLKTNGKAYLVACEYKWNASRVKDPCYAPDAKYKFYQDENYTLLEGISPQFPHKEK